ncbi:MAG: sulfatase [Bacteroidota bacterium]
MRILYIDIDSLRPDHLGCYGYHRDTSPNIDKIAQQGVRFDNVYVSDAPCLPSRTALWSGRFGIHTGVINHGGEAADPVNEGPTRSFEGLFAHTSWMSSLQQAGFKTATVSSFGERHGGWHWYAGYSEIYNPGKRGSETADEVTPIALDWLERNAKTDNWFLHVNFWDPHTAYRTPEEYGNPFENDPLPEWMTEELLQELWEGYGPHSPQEPHGFPSDPLAQSNYETHPRVPKQLDSMETLKQWIDGYDTGIHYADKHVGIILNALEEAGILDETVIMISSDHSESQGELNVWGDHQTADEGTSHVPLIVRWPGITDQSRVDEALHYQFDWAATLIELAGGQVPKVWDGEPFTEAFLAGQEQGRDYLVISQAAWACQRGVRFDMDDEKYLCISTYHDGFKEVDPVMLFNLTQDPYEQKNLCEERPDLVNRAKGMLGEWHNEMILTSHHNTDPMMTVLREGGPFHTRGELPAYLEHLRATGRAHHAERLASLHPDEI